MATRTQLLYDLNNTVDRATLSLEWDDVTLAVNALILNVSQGARGATVTITRLPDGATRSHDYSAGANVRWVPPIPITVTLFTNQKTGQTVALLPDYIIDLALD
jgi:hypothetical protein